MPHMKSRDSHPPGGWKFVQPQTNFHAPEWQSFSTVVAAVISHRRGNAILQTQYGLSIDQATVENEVDTFNAAICKANGWSEFYADDDSPVPFPSRPYQPVVGVAEHVRRAAVGVGAMKDWLGEGMKPTDRTRAEARAVVCLRCKENADPDWFQKLDAAAAEIIKGLIEARNKMQLVTTLDASLHSCRACDCALRLKVWVPPEIVQERTSDKLRAHLKEVKPDCWVIQEAASLS